MRVETRIDGLGDDNVSGVQVNFEIFFGEVELDDAVTGIGIEIDLLELVGERGRGGCCVGVEGEQEREGKAADHLISLAEAASRGLAPNSRNSRRAAARPEVEEGRERPSRRIGRFLCLEARRL